MYLENTNVVSIFASRLYRLRKSKQINQSQLAEALGISRSAVAFYENAQRNPDIEVLSRISKYFDVSCDYLLGKIDQNHLDNENLVTQLGLDDENLELLFTLDTAINISREQLDAKESEDGEILGELEEISIDLTYPVLRQNQYVINLLLYVILNSVNDDPESSLPQKINNYFANTVLGHAKDMSNHLMNSPNCQYTKQDAKTIENGIIQNSQKAMIDSFLCVVETMQSEFNRAFKIRKKEL